MITESGTLTIFDGSGIKIDTKLPKYASLEEIKNASSLTFNSNSFTSSSATPSYTVEDIINFAGISTDDGMHNFNITISQTLKENLRKSQNNNWIVEPNISEIGGNAESKKKSIFSKAKYIFKTFLKKEPEEVETMDIIEFFNQVKLLAGTEQKYIDRVKEYQNMIIRVDKTGQVALKERLLNDLCINKYESALYAANIYRVVTEEQLVKFAKKCPKGLSLTYIKNFMHVIPDEVIKAKETIDKLEVFDNYVILHYDPDKKGYAKTEKEKEVEYQRKKDPILFGVISGVRKLYYIGDWIDDYCDLTLETIVDTLGKEELQKSELTDQIKL
jgi:hypothetical protein